MWVSSADEQSRDPSVSLPVACIYRLGQFRESYEWRHDSGGVPQSLDGGVRALLEVVVVTGHMEGWEGGPARGQGGGCERRHGQAAVGGQRSLDGVRQGRGSRQGLRVLEAGETRGGGDPGAEGQVIGGSERRT